MVQPNSINKTNESTIRVPFDSARHAEIAFRVLSVDLEPHRNFVQKKLSLEGDVLTVHFSADQVKNLRTAITSFFECLLLCQDTIKQFGAPTLDQNAGTQPSAHTA
ncbi:EKC/KEOPS complex subunit LAGE3 [Scaptodrosophila lebanonensis]|uniref:L antigen family member 3 n=1 Tax=Drosophila lebanonensis TaxID=7225 RepID=A0A6J2TIC6_DROLE|nr:EKC/KEOPS complex subunit LAGE3 [Scaptodrosophila lebanonensis]